MASSRLEFGVAKRRNECNRWNIRLSISVVNRMKKYRMDKKEVVVVVPVYRPELTVWERASLRQTVRVLQENYPVELLVPCGMDC